MRVGLTYDLRDDYLAAGHSEEETAEFDRAETIDALADALRALGHEVDRVGRARALVERLARGDRWDLVFNICEGLRGLGRESQVPALLDVYDIPYTFSDPLGMALGLHKGHSKTVALRAGVPTAAFAVIESLADLPTSGAKPPDGDAAPREPAAANLALRAGLLFEHTPAGQLAALRYPLFAKPVAEGTGKGVTPASKIRSPAELAPRCQELLARHQQPVLIEEFLPGREFTVGLLGTGPAARVLGTLEIVLLPGAEADVYSYVNKERCEELVEYRLVKPTDPEVAAAEQIALRAWRALGCRDAGRVDLRGDAQGLPRFLEVNPLAGLHPSHSDLPMLCTALGMPYVDLIGEIVRSAMARVFPRPGAARRADSRV